MKKKIIIILILIIISIAVILILYNLSLKKEEKLLKDQIDNIREHFNTYVTLNKDTQIYNKDNNIIGTIYKGTNIILEDQEIDSNTKYFYSKNLGYIPYENVSPIDEFNKDNRYKKYIPYNENIVTKENYTIYDKDGNKMYTFNNSNSYPILINNYDDKYYIEYNDELVYVLGNDIEEIISNENTEQKNASAITTLCYHRVYNTNEKCPYEQLCKSQENFDKEMQYLSDNEYLTLTMEEMYLYITNKLQIPQNSILITLDDGKLVTSAIEVLEKYNLHATVFLITGTFTDYDSVNSSAIELQSHTNDMHTTGVCPTQTSYQQGGGILCLSEDEILEDLTKSIEKLNGAIALAYPFYDYNDRAIKLVEKAGFKLAFIGAANTDGRATTSTNQYKIPRMTIWDTTTFEEYQEIVTN